jgi:SAM-dependent methyltransferase
MIPDSELNIWDHSRALEALLERRASDLEPEMDCAAQAAEIIGSLGFPKGSRILDLGCGAGHFIHSLKKRGLDYDYRGLDSSRVAIAAGKRGFKSIGLDPGLLTLGSIEDLRGARADLALFMNVLSFNPDYRRPLDRAAACGARALLIRDNFGPKTEMLYDLDGYLDEGWNSLKGYWNRWAVSEMRSFLESLGYSSRFISDRRTEGRPEPVVGKPYTWGFLLATRG